MRRNDEIAQRTQQLLEMVKQRMPERFASWAPSVANPSYELPEIMRRIDGLGPPTFPVTQHGVSL